MPRVPTQATPKDQMTKRTKILMAVGIILAIACAFLLVGCKATTTVDKDGVVTATQKVAANAYAAAKAESSIVAAFHANLIKCAALKQAYVAAIVPTRLLIDEQWETVNGVGAKADYLDAIDKIIGGIEIVGNAQEIIDFRKRALAANLTPDEIQAFADEAEAAEVAAREALDAIYESCGGEL